MSEDRIEYGPFTGGLNRLIDKNSLQANELWDVLGIPVEEIGKIHHAWEKVAGFATTTGVYSISFWDSFADGVDINIILSNGNGIVTVEPEVRISYYGTWVPPSGQDPYTARNGSMAKAYANVLDYPGHKPGAPVSFDYSDADVIEYRGVLFVFQKDAPARAFIPLKQSSLKRMADNDTSYVVSWAADPLQTLKSDSRLGRHINTGFEREYVTNSLSGYPVWLSKRYIERSSSTNPNTNQIYYQSSAYAGGGGVPAGPWTYIGYQGAPYIGAPFNYDSLDEVLDVGGERSWVYFSDSDFFDANKMRFGSYFGRLRKSPDNAGSNETGILTQTVVDDFNSYRVPVPGQWHKLALPAIYKERLVAVDFAKYSGVGLSRGIKIFTDPDGNQAQDTGGLKIYGADFTVVKEIYELTISGAGSFGSGNSSYAVSQADIGDIFVIQGPVGSEADPELLDNSAFGGGAYQMVVEIVGYASQTHFRPIVKFISGERTDISLWANAAHFWHYKKNPSYGKRLAFFGRPPGSFALNPDAPNYESADLYDWMIEDTGAQIAFVDPALGEIIQLVSLEDGLLVFFENGIRKVVGTPPVGEAVPQDFAVDVISDKIGLTDKNAVVLDDEAQTVYFCAKDGIYRFYGNSIERIDDQIRRHPGYTLPFTYAQKQEKWLYFSSQGGGKYGEASDGSIFMYDLVTQTWYRDRRIDGADNRLMAPFSGREGYPELVFLTNGSTPNTYNDFRNIPSYPGEGGSIPHPCMLETGFVGDGSPGTKMPRRVSVKTSKNDPNAAPATQCQVTLAGDGISPTTRIKAPLNRQPRDILKYRANARSNSIGAENFSVKVFDGTTQVPGSIDRVYLDVINTDRDF